MSENKENLDEIYKHYFGEGNVNVIITAEADTKNVDALAAAISQYDEIRDVFMVTGDSDIISRASFESMQHMKDFLLNKLGDLPGVTGTKTMMVVNTYKVNGNVMD